MEASNGQPTTGKICAEVSVRILVSGQSYEEIGRKLDAVAKGIDPSETGVDFAHMVGFNRRPCPGGMDPYEMEKRAAIMRGEQPMDSPEPNYGGDQAMTMAVPRF